MIGNKKILSKTPALTIAFTLSHRKNQSVMQWPSYVAHTPKYLVMTHSPQVHILLAVRNGLPHLVDQLNSILDQTYCNWHLWISDDASTDGSTDHLTDFASRYSSRVTFVNGPNQGATKNFMSLLTAQERTKGYVAFCDQDDIWYPDKLARAVDALQKTKHPISLYCSRTDVGTDPTQKPYHKSPLRESPLGLRNALIQSASGGNTMVLSPDAAELARTAGAGPTPSFHDWWCYQIVSAMGGETIYDTQPSMFYRQHEGNLIGPNRGMSARFARIKYLHSGIFRRWVDSNTASLDYMDGAFSTETRKVLHRFKNMREKRGLPVIKDWYSLGLYRQNRTETHILATASSLGKL